MIFFGITFQGLGSNSVRPRGRFKLCHSAVPARLRALALSVGTANDDKLFRYGSFLTAELVEVNSYRVI